MTLAVLLMALCFDAAIGYPDWVYRNIGHPVTWIGALLSWLDARLNVSTRSFNARRLGGIVALILLTGVPVAVAILLHRILLRMPLAYAIDAIVASTLFASKSLHDHVRDVAVALQGDGLAAGQREVAKIVGRDPEALDGHGVARAAIESLAENASDGVVAPVFWFAVLGLPGLIAYKAINTADSMIGHRTARYEAFGWAAARADDFINLPASRLTGLLFALAAIVTPGASFWNSMRSMGRDASRHRSPNAGWPESAMAGALGLKLAGPRQYGGTLVDDAFMGDGRRDATAVDIQRALSLARHAWGLMMLSILALFVIGRIAA